MRRAVRALAGRPVFATTAVAMLALGLGVNAAIFSLTRAMLLRPLPYRDADRLVKVYEINRSRGNTNVATTPVNYVAWQGRVDAFERTTLYTRVQFNVFAAGHAMQVEGFRVDSPFFPMLGIEPALGRGFSDDDMQPGRDNVVLLTDGFWRRQFGGDPAIVGTTVSIDGTPCTIAGVLPSSFKIFRVLNRELDVFRPLVLDPTDREHSVNVWAKLKPGVSIEQARTQLAAVYATLPNTDPGWSATAELMSARFAAYSSSILPLLEGAVGLVLLIACANVANLLLAVAAERRHELAVRLALGAGRWRIARDLAGESVLLGAVGALSATVLAVWMVGAFNAVISFSDLNRSEPFRVDGWVLAFTVGLAAIVVLVFALLPARAAGSADLVESLKESTHGVTAAAGSRRLRQALIVGELALSIVLAASAMVVARSALALHDLRRGITVDGVMTAQVALNDPRYADSSRMVRVTSDIVGRLRASPGIDRAAVVNYVPLALIRVGVRVNIEGYVPPGDHAPVARYFVVDPGYLSAVGVGLRAGRNFTAADDMNGAAVAIVSESFARRFWNGDAVGRHLRAAFPTSDAFWIPRAKGGTLTVVGVVADVREDGLPDSAGFPQLYLPYAQNPTVVVTLLARSSGRPAGDAVRAIRDAVRAVDAQLPLSYEMAFDDVLRETFARPREVAWLVGAFAVLAFVLSAVGVYGVVAYSTTARAHEIRIRIALGATRSDIVALIVRQALALTAAGAAIGIVVTPVSLRLARDLLFGVNPLDPWTLAAVTVGLTLVSAAAAAIPAVRATSVPNSG